MCLYIYASVCYMTFFVNHQTDGVLKITLTEKEGNLANVYYSSSNVCLHIKMAPQQGN